MSECKKRGGGKCKIWRTFMNQCAAVIAGEGLSATDNAPTKREAIDLGMEQCRRDGGGDCRLYCSGCSRAWGSWELWPKVLNSGVTPVSRRVDLREALPSPCSETGTGPGSIHP